MAAEKLETTTQPQRGSRHMGWRNEKKNYYWRGTYHITITVTNRNWQPLGRIAGSADKPDGDPQAPHVELTAVGRMVEQELTTSITAHYPMVEVQDYVVMPDHLHFIVVVHGDIVSSSGRRAHLGQVVAGFKKGCNRRYWEITGQKGSSEAQPGQGKPAPASRPTPATAPAAAGGAALLPAVYPQGYKVPSWGTTGRPPLFAYGYVDVMPLREGQLETQRRYIRNNPRNRLLRMTHRESLQICRATIDTALTLPALKGYLQRECPGTQFGDETWATLRQRLLTNGTTVTCDSYGNRQLLAGRLLPVVCHRRDSSLFARQKTCCLEAAAAGAVLVSAKIAKGEQDIIHTAIDEGFPVITVEDNGFPERYHPSEQRAALCADDKLLIVTPWRYAYRRVGDAISVAVCKSMNCVAQALCRTKDSWWKSVVALVGCMLLLASCQTDGHRQDGGVFQPVDIGMEANVSCFETEPNGGIWIGMDGQGLAYRESASAPYRHYNKLGGTLPSDVVICNYRDAEGRLWFGSFGNGLFYWDGQAFCLPENEQLRSKDLEYVGGFAEDTDGRLWIATQKEGLACLDTTGNVRFFNKENSSLPTNWLADIKTFDRRKLFIATGWGLFTLDTSNNQLAPLLDSHGKAFLEKQLIRILYPAPDGLLWIGTAAGLYMFRPDTKTYRHLTTDDGLAENFIRAIGGDRQGNIWVTGEYSVTCILRQGAEAKEPGQCVAFRQESGVGNHPFHVRAITCLNDGTLLFGTSKGCIRVNPEQAIRAVTETAPRVPYYIVAALAVFLACVLVYWNRRRKTSKQIPLQPIEPTKLQISSVDEQLKSKAIQVVEAHIDNSDFSVEQLSEALGMSRGHLYKRLVAITGKTPIEFIRTIRVKRGRQLLEESGEGVSQIAWRIGMSPKQFAKYFKEEYGLLPSDFIRSKASKATHDGE